MISKTLAVMIKIDSVAHLGGESFSSSQWGAPGILTQCPPNRYEGELVIDGQSLVFRGRDVRAGKFCEEVIPLGRIIEISLAFDERLKDSMNPSSGIGGSVPFAVRYQGDGREQIACFNTYLNHLAYFNPYLSHHSLRITNRNRDWYETLMNRITALHGGNRRERDTVRIPAEATTKVT